MFFENDLFPLQIHCCSPVKNKKELPRKLMIMHFLRCARRHSLLNHAEVVPVEKVPSIATVSPEIMFCVLDAGGFPFSVHEFARHTPSRTLEPSLRNRLNILIIADVISANCPAHTSL